MDFNKRIVPPFLNSPIFSIKRRIRDPLYNYIHITELENMLIDTPEFQRLDRLYQNPIVRYVYPNGTHTRKAHSLGVMHLYHKAILRILYHQSEDYRKNIHPLYAIPISKVESNLFDNLDNFSDSWFNSKTFIEIIQIGRICALIHDIGHGPFSHLFEEVCNNIAKEDSGFKFNHENIALQIIHDKFDKYFTHPFQLDDIFYILDKSKKTIFLREIIDGPYDVDKLDYINRDSYHCGTTEFGNIDYDRIIDGFRIKGEKLLISKSSLGALMNSFNSLQLIYTHIYYHKTCRIFNYMIIDALNLIPEFVKEIAIDTNKLLESDDTSFLMDIKHNSSKKNFNKSWEILKDVLDRKKKYSTILIHQVTLGIAREIKEKLLKLKNDFEEKYKDIDLIFDFTGAIKGLRIDPSRVFDWLLNPQIVDEEDNNIPLKNLKEVSESYYNRLKEYQIVIYIFVNREKKEKIDNYAKIESIKAEINQEIKILEQTANL